MWIFRSRPELGSGPSRAGQPRENQASCRATAAAWPSLRVVRDVIDNQDRPAGAKPSGLPHALAWQRKASAWLSARRWPRFSGAGPKGGPAPLQAADFR